MTDRKILRRTKFGNPLLRQPARQLSRKEILSAAAQNLIADIRYTLERRKYGVGLAAPQVGQGIALSVIGIKPTPSRPDNPRVDLVIINPEIVQTYGDKQRMWEGCMSFGSGEDVPYALVPRFAKVRLRWLDEHAEQQEADFEGIVAHVIQHEVDHLQGILFVDKVEDTTSYTTIGEYKKRQRKRSDNATLGA